MASNQGSQVAPPLVSYLRLMSELTKHINSKFQKMIDICPDGPDSKSTDRALYDLGREWHKNYSEKTLNIVSGVRISGNYLQELIQNSTDHIHKEDLKSAVKTLDVIIYEIQGLSRRITESVVFFNSVKGKEIFDSIPKILLNFKLPGDKRRLEYFETGYAENVEVMKTATGDRIDWTDGGLFAVPKGNFEIETRHRKYEAAVVQFRRYGKGHGVSWWSRSKEFSRTSRARRITSRRSNSCSKRKIAKTHWDVSSLPFRNGICLLRKPPSWKPTSACLDLVRWRHGHNAGKSIPKSYNTYNWTIFTRMFYVMWFTIVRI